MKRTLYTLSAAAALLGAAPAITFADTRPRHADTASCRCADMRTHARPVTAADRDGALPSETTTLTDRESEFLQEVWSAP